MAVGYVMPWALALLFLAIGLSGCTDPPREAEPPEPSADPTPGGGDGGGGARDVYGVKPLWFPGLQWTYEANYPARQVSGPLKLTVVREEGNGFQLSADADEDLLKWALFVHAPALGPVDAANMNPTIHGQTVQWFDFPLTDGKTWSAPEHHGTTVNYTATRIETQIPDGRTVPAFDVVGERGGTTWVHYVYTAEVAFCTLIEVDGDGDGQMDARLELTDARATQAHRTLTTFEPTELVMFTDRGTESLADMPVATEFTVSSDATDLYAFFVLGGPTGHYSAAVTLPSGTSHQWNHTNTDQDFRVMVIGERFDATPGGGETGSIILGDGFVFGELFEVVRREPGS